MSLRNSAVFLTLAVAVIGAAGCTPEPSGPIPDPTYVRIVSVVPATSDMLIPGARVQAIARVFADHKHNSAALALYVQTGRDEAVTEPVFKSIPAGPGQYTLEQTFTVPTDASKVYLVAALFEQGAEESHVISDTAWKVQR